MMKLNIQMFASTNKTTNYELPQFVGTDKPTWLGDFNTAMSAIDTGMAENKSDIESMDSRVANAEASASQASQDVATLATTVGNLSTDVESATSTANNAQQTATSALNTANTANGKANTNATNISTNTSKISALETTVNNANSYSTSEKVIGTWIDGKKLYRKIINFGALPNSSLKSVNHNISNLNKIVYLTGFAESSQNKGGITLPHATRTPIALYADTTTVDVLSTSDASAYTTTFIIIEYTKTTN